MIRYVTPYSTEKKFFDVIDFEIMLSPNLNDWVCIRDGDTAFLTSNFGHLIEDYIRKYPDTGLFTSYASRCHYACQVPRQSLMEIDSIIYHHKIANQHSEEFHLQVNEINRRIAGHLMVIQKRTWLKIRNEVKITAAQKNILGVDTKISNAILKNGLKIRLMKGIYILHYLRMEEGFNNTNHLK